MTRKYAWTGKQFKEEASVLSQGVANRGKIRDNFFLNRTISLWNDPLDIFMDFFVQKFRI